MSQKMESNKIHLVAFNKDNSRYFYTVIDTTAGTTTSESIYFWILTNKIFESVFIEPAGAPTFQFNIADPQLAKQAYSVGEIQLMTKNNGEVISTILTQTESCYNDATDFYNRPTSFI